MKRLFVGLILGLVIFSLGVVGAGDLTREGCIERDVNGDNFVDFGDFANVVPYVNACNKPMQTCILDYIVPYHLQTCVAGDTECISRDVNGDNFVDFGDFAEILPYFNACRGGLTESCVTSYFAPYQTKDCNDIRQKNEGANGTITNASNVIKTEQITCTFKNSDKEQECYLAGQFTPADEGTKFCKGEESCFINYRGYEGEEVTWKSTCGSYQYTKQDGEDEGIVFNCGTGETNVTEIENKGFRFARWGCYGGEEQKSEDKTSCKPSEIWQEYAKEFCRGSCYADGSKCGVNSFSVWNECYSDLGDFPIVDVGEGSTETDIGLICKDSCPLDGKCYPFGYRKSGEYCSDEEGFVGQKTGEVACENNFECDSNVCVDGECIKPGFFKRVMNWFARWFS